MVSQATDDIRIKAMKELLSPEQLLQEYPLTDTASATVLQCPRRYSGYITRQG